MQTIDRRWLPLNALRAFEGVARHGSFTGAAHALSISQSALSQHVIALERLIGVRLFERRRCGLVLTEAGEHMLAAVGKSLDRLEYAIDEICCEAVPARRTLRVQMPLSFAVHLAVPILREFRQRWAEVNVDLVSPSAVGPPLRDMDVAVMYSRSSAGNLAADLLWPLRLRILCHPRLADRHRGNSLAAFIEANELVHVRNYGATRHEAWSRFVRGNGLGGHSVARGPVFDSAALAVRYVSGGEGIALLDAQLFIAEVRSGRLVSPFAAELDTGYACYLVTHPEGRSDPGVALFRSWLLERFGQRGATEQSVSPLAFLGDRNRARPGKSGTR